MRHDRMMRMMCVGLLVLSAASAQAQSRSLAPAAPVASDESVLSAERLSRVSPVVERYVREERLAGAVTLVLDHGRIAHLQAHGYADLERRTPMTTDTMFRIASMSKAVTSVAIMMLVDRGDILLTDPVSKFIPTFARTTVAVTPPKGTRTPARVVPATRPPTIRELLSHTAGIGYGGGPFAEKYKAAGFDSWYFAHQTEPLAVMIDRLAQLPFDAQPGERYVYGYNTDILGRVVEVVSGQDLDTFFRTQIFEPLKMVDTHFFVPKEKASRLATVYGVDESGTGKVRRMPDGERAGQGHYVEGPRTCFSGGAGLVSTARDYARLLQMLLQRGELDGVRILSPAAVASMTSNHAGARYRDGDMGFGLGFEIAEHVGRAARLTSVGTYGWGSAYYSTYMVVPQEGIVAIFLSQTLPAGTLDLQDKFKGLVIQALDRVTER